MEKLKKFIKLILLAFLAFLIWKVSYYHEDTFLPALVDEQGAEEGSRFIESFKGFKRKTVCDKTLEYDIGTIDEGFEIEEEDLWEILVQSEQVWEGELSHNLFQYNPEAEFKINLIFDERQERAQEYLKIEKFQEGVEQEQEEILDEYQKLVLLYEKKQKDYLGIFEDYKEKIDDYNNEVELWNKAGGAPEDDYERLKQEKDELEKEREDLDDELEVLDELSDRISELTDKENQLVKDFNSRLDTYDKRFGESREFDQGIYTGSEINVYKFYDDLDLRMVLVHELGHALRLDHNENPKSIMYYLMGEQEIDPITLTAEDIQSLKEVCNLR